MEEIEYSVHPKAIKSRKRYSRLPKEVRTGLAQVKNVKLQARFDADPVYREEHLKKQRLAVKKIRDKIPEGLCKVALHCKQPQVGKSKYCLAHWLTSISRSYDGRKDNRCVPIDADVVKSLWQAQKGLCALTGLPLVPGETASIDHIKAISSGGTHERANLRFVHKSLNSLKGVLSE